MNAAFTRKFGAAGRRSFGARRRAARGGLTLVEIIIAVTLSALLITSAVQIFSMLGEGINEAQATLEGADRLRAAAAQLERDLSGITVDMIPPVSHGGYFELIEGVETTPASAAIAVNSTGGTDTTVGDVDDILMFTTQNYTIPFRGRVNGTVVTSNVAEVAWFLRGTNLYRRVLLVKPGINVSGSTGYYLNSDISANNSTGSLRANSLDDLTRRENRFGHSSTAFPYLADWGDSRLPTLGDSDAISVGQTPDPSVLTQVTYPLDFWMQPFQEGNNPTDGNSIRAREDIILTNVLMFDVKVWDPTAGTNGTGDYVDLGTAGTLFDSNRIDSRCGVIGPPYIYDTWCRGYESDNIAQGTRPEEGADGFDNDGLNGADDPGEWQTSPPYPIPLRGIQIRLRVFEKSSLAVQELTVNADFVK